MENLNRTIISKKIESIIKSFPSNKSPAFDGFTAKFYETFNKLIPILKLLQKLKSME
jgi:hypothetical protein